MARRRKKAPNKTTPVIETKEPNNQTLNGNKSWGRWGKALFGLAGWFFFLLAEIFGDGAFWQWRQSKRELKENLLSHITQAIQVEREKIEVCFRKETLGSGEIYYEPRSDFEKIQTGCHLKEKHLSFLNQTIREEEEELAKIEQREPRKITVDLFSERQPPVLFMVE